jgi:transcriptional regulator PpsR
MQARASSTAARQFKFPRKSLGDVDAAGAARLIAAASDLAFVVDGAGKVLDVSTSMASLQKENPPGWVGRNLVELLAPESQGKVEKLISEARDGDPSRWREFNFQLRSGAVATVNCCAALAGGKDRIVVFGRDQSATAAIQQRLLAAQAETEREYGRLRQAETRFAILFESSAEPMLIVAPTTYRISEANPAALALLGRNAKRIVGRSLIDLFDSGGGRTVATMLATVHGAGYAEEARATVNDREMRVSATMFRHDRGEQFLVRLEPVADRAGALRNAPNLGGAIESLPDAFVVADGDFRIVRANAAFLEMAQVTSPTLVREEPLDRWLGRPGVDMDALAAILKQHGFVRNFHTVLRGARGLDEDVEVSAVSVPDADLPTFNIAIRSVPRRRAAASRVGRELPQSVEQMTELVGRVPLKDMVREATEWIEKLSIEAALLVTGDNRASAADMLGFSRQSLYMKMRRFGLGDSEPDDES